MGLEVEEYYSTTCLYNILFTNMQKNHLIGEKKTQMQLIYLMENLLLAKKIFNKEVLDNYSRVLLLNALHLAENEFMVGFVYFLKQFFDVK